MSIAINISSVKYGKRTVLSNVEAELSDGSVTAVIGRNGSGKSTLVSAILSLVKYDGKITVDGADMQPLDERERALRISGITQMLRAPHITVGELVNFGRNPHSSLRGLSDKDALAIDSAICRASLTMLRNAYLDEISGGELKRAYFAMLLAQDTKNIVLDEATAFMDVDYENTLLTHLRKLSKEEGKTVIAVVHNLDLAVRYADNILLLEDGRIKFFGSTEQTLSERIIEESFNLRRVEVGGTSLFTTRFSN